MAATPAILTIALIIFRVNKDKYLYLRDKYLYFATFKNGIGAPA
jgi:hypothetical protein